MSQIANLQRVVYFSIRDLKAIRSLVSHVVTSRHDSIILPYSDYPGPLSREITSRDFRSLTVCEPDPVKRIGFKNYVNKYHPDKNVHIYSDDLFDLSHKTHSDTAQNRCAELVRNSRVATNMSAGAEEECDTNTKLILPLLKSKNETGFLRNLYYQVCLRLGLCSNTLVHYYFLMSDRQQAYMCAKAGDNLMLYRSASVLYNTIFEVNTLESYDLQKCFEINLRKIQKTAAARNATYTKVHLVRLLPRSEVLERLGPRSLIEFRFLVIQMMQKRRGLVVDFLDRFFDNYLIDVARFGITRTSRSGDLTKEQYYELFLYLSQRPDYRNSIFLQAVSNSEDSILSLDQ